MTSSTSSSDTVSQRRWIVTLLATFFGGAALLYAVLLLIDPYDSARFPSLGLVGVADSNLRMADVSRGRDPQFDAALFGSSTGQSLDPHRLSAATGLHFVQLAITQAGPREILALLGWFTSHRAQLGAVIITADVEWCSSDQSLNLRYPFPFWLYGDNWDYLTNVLNWKSFDRVVWRLQIALGKKRPNDPTGYFPFTPPGGDFGFAANPPMQPNLGPPTAPFPWIEALTRALERLDPAPAVVILMPPVQRDYLPPPGSPGNARISACKTALAHLVAKQPRRFLIDDRRDSAIARDSANFFDRVHYRAPVARMLEEQVIALLTGHAPVQPVALRDAAIDNTP